MCFVDLEKAFDQVPRKVLKLAMRKKGMSPFIFSLVIDVVIEFAREGVLSYRMLMT